MTEPLVSVLVPCFNSERFIGETLDNILNQSWKNVEVIVVDDGSTDGSTDVVERFTDSRVRLVRQPNGGVCHARNVALGFANGEYIQYLDADDLISADKISLQVERLRNHPRAIASGEWGRFHFELGDGRLERDETWADLTPLDWIAKGWRGGVPMHCVHMWLIPRVVCEIAGPWNENLVQNTDGEYITRVLLASDRVLFCAGATAYYRSGLPNSVSRQAGTSHRESRFLALHLCERHVLARENSDRMRRGFSLAWQNLAHFTHPYDPGLAEQALGRARALHAIDSKPGGGVMFKLIRNILGWRTARRLQIMSGRP